jgi:hypothetical protein
LGLFTTFERTGLEGTLDFVLGQNAIQIPIRPSADLVHEFFLGHDAIQIPVRGLKKTPLSGPFSQTSCAGDGTGSDGLYYTR